MEKQSILQKKWEKRGFSQKYITKFLLLFFLIACSNAAFGSKRAGDQITANYVNGVSEWTSTNNWRTEPFFTQTVKDGYIVFIVPVYRTYKEAGMTYHDGFYTEGGWLEIKIENCPETYIVEDNSLLIKNGTTVTTYAPVYYSDPNAPSTEYSFITFKVPLLNSMLSTSLSITYSGRWTINGLYYDDTFKNKSKSIDTSTPTKMSQVSTTSSFSVLDNMPVIAVTWTKTESGDCNSGDYAIYNGTTLLGTKTASTNSGTFNIPYDKIDINQANTLKIKRILAQLTVESGSVEVKAFPQLKSQSFKAAFNNQTRKIDLTWEIPIPSGNYDNSVFKISEANGYLTDTEKTKSYSSTTSIYTHSIDVPETAENRDYSFTITRGWGKTFDQTVTLSKISGKHISLATVKDTVELDNALSKATVNWTTEGYVWSPGSELRITRIKNSSFTDIIKITDSVAVRSGKYEDKMIQICNQYRYELQIIPGSSSYMTKDNMVTLDFVPTRIGRITNITASKGYFSNRIELSWQVEGVFNNFSILRKEYNQDDSQYKQIIPVTASGTQTQYNEDDLNAVPGVVYSYKIVGYVSCGGQTKESVSKPTDIGFRTPTGDFYGRVVFSNGQGVGGVSVDLSSETNLLGKSYKLDSLGSLTVSNTTLLSDTIDKAITVQAWIKRDAISGKNVPAHLIRKEGNFDLFVDKDYLKFTVGSVTATSNSTLTSFDNLNTYVHVSAVLRTDSIFLYINGEKAGKAGRVTSFKPTAKSVVMGGSYKGYLDEVRMWNRALPADEIKRDYNRMLTGGENGLKAYYTFDYAVDTTFFDMSFKDNSYNMNHGKSKGAVLDSYLVPSSSQLGYKGITNTDGSYSIRSVPYMGNGTAYSLVPSLGIHSFEPSKDIRFLGPGAQSHTVNFTDNSSFPVSGTVTYEGGTVPVEGVMFQIDGRTAMQGNGSIITSDAQGNYTIYVPVGYHEVKAVKNNHTFVDDGKILDINKRDLNYQDKLVGREIYDNTKVRYIGRVAGGVIQEAYPVGFRLSKNNVADSVKVELTFTKPGDIRYKDTLVTMVSQNKKPKDSIVYSNKVVYEAKKITIYPDPTTGEFAADIIPESFKVTAIVPGHENATISGNGNLIDFSNSSLKQSETTPSPIKAGQTDSVFYNKLQKFILRYTPTIRVKQMNASNEEMDYFGSDSLQMTGVVPGANFVSKFYDKNAAAGKKYTIGLPVFEQAKKYVFKAKIFEEYVYKGADGKDKLTNGVNVRDEVPTLDGKITFGNELRPADQKGKELSVDSMGEVRDTIAIGNPNQVIPVKEFSVSAKYGTGNNPTIIGWKDNFNAVIVGAVLDGTNFVTGGPDNLLFILRDPPGSNSYSYIENGYTVSKSSTFEGSIVNTNSYNFATNLGSGVTTFAGVGAGLITDTQVANEIDLGFHHTEEISGTSGNTTTTTLLNRYQTSASPDFVGADGDVFVGYSTNLTFGATNNLSVVSLDYYNKYPNKFEPVVDVTNPALGTYKWILVKNKGLGIMKNFGTLFAYPQKAIETEIIPNLIKLRNNLLIPDPDKKGSAYWQGQANAENKTLYVSHLNPNDENYGKSNTDTIAFKPFPDDIYNGQSYSVYSPNNVNKRDTILALNNYIQNWINRLADNEKAKVNSVLQQNYSFHSGSPISYSKNVTQDHMETQHFSVAIGFDMALMVGFSVNKAGVLFQFTENAELTNGGSWSQTTTNSSEKGFTMEDDGTNDYLSVDVCSETNDPASDFVFKTQAGATSCPYEDGTVTKYFLPGTPLNAATVRVEMPSISVEKNLIVNVPSGMPAYLTVTLGNNSSTNTDGIFDLKIVDKYNRYGAKLIMDGAPIGNGRSIAVPAGQTVKKTLEVLKGTVMNYDSLRLVFQSQCQPEVGDTVIFSVHFTPSCTEVNLKEPDFNWVYNTELPTYPVSPTIFKHKMPVVIDKFDVNYDNFNRLELQIKPASGGENAWTTLMSYYNNSQIYEKANGNKMMIDPNDNGVIRYDLKMDDEYDQQYDLRVVSVCTINGDEVRNFSQTKRGIKDMYTPRLFGNPLPANGILTVNDEVRLNFNEKIADGYLVNQNFTVETVKNGSTLDGSTSVLLDGVNDELTSEASRSWKGKNITVAMKVMTSGDLKDATYFSHGNKANSLEFGVTSGGRLKMIIGNDSVINVNSVPFTKNNWAYVAFSIDSLGKINAYYNDVELIASATSKNYVYTGEGNIVIGKSISGENDFFAGKILNVKVWNKIVDFGTLKTEKDKFYSGLESNLIDYYPMNEAKGSLLQDRASGANLQMNGAVWALPQGYGVKFNGKDQYLKVSTENLVIEKAMDYTMEFWFKASSLQSKDTVIMVSNGDGDGNDLAGSKDLFSIGFRKTTLTFINNQVIVPVTGNYLDDNWHHFALSVNRNNGRGQICMDGKLNTYFDNSGLGSISAANIYIGARGWISKTSNQQVLIDRYFKGNIDEFRIWDLYKNEQIVSQNNNKKLDGTEKGLRAYYPFEDYVNNFGINEMVFSTKDFKIPRINDPKVADGVATGTIDALENAPVANKGPVSKVEYSFVVNNDALIISLKEQPDKIEKTIVTFTVEDVRDVNGNKLKSPIIWSAYIDRNLLKWNTTEYNLEKQVYQPMEFTNEIVNKGGAMAHYTLIGMPSWLTATPSDGIINPASSAKIKFTVAEGLNIGTYNEIIFMRNDDNVVEALPINIRVLGEQPDWTVNPADYNSNMSVFGKIRLNGIFSNDKEDILSAFSNGKCVGVTKNMYDKVNDFWYTFLTIYGDKDQKATNLEFRIWDASTGNIFAATPSDTIKFASDKVYGSGKTPIIFDGEKMFFSNIPLKSGWNWVSFNLGNLALKDLNATLANGKWTDKDFVKNLKYLDSYDPAKQAWYGSLSLNGGLNNTTMFMIRSENDQILSTSGKYIRPDSLAINVQGQKWNYISYLPNVNQTVKEALAGYAAGEGDIIKSQNQFSMFSTGIGWIGNLTYMEANKGYMLKRVAAGDVTFKYPSKSGTLSFIPMMSKAKDAQNTLFSNNNYPENMSIIAQSIGLASNDKILAYVNGELRGVSENVSYEGAPLKFISISGDNNINSVVQFVLEREGKVIARSSNRVVYASNSVAGSLVKPFVIDFSNTGNIVNVSPNPFKERLFINASVEKGDQIEIGIYDVLGRLVHNLGKVTATEDYYQTEWNASELKEGVYLVRVSINGENSVHKVEKK